MKRVLVTGGCGFVGRHLVKRLMAEHCQVHVVDDLSTGLHPNDWPEDIYHDIFPANFVQGDCRAYFRGELIGSKPAGMFDEIYHCAAVVGGRLKIEGDPLAVATDLAIDSDFFNWVVADKPLTRKVIYFSSSAIYPVDLQTRKVHCQLSEAMVSHDALRIGRPDASYGFAKLAGEYLALLASRLYGLDVAIYRPFSGYGEDQDDSYPFPAVLKRVHRGDDPITVWGSGDQMRDWIHIDDVVDAVMATKHLLSGTVLNLGTGVGVSSRDLATTAAMLRGIALPQVVNDDTRPEGVFHRVCDPYNLSRHWTFKIPLKEGIERMFEHLDRQAGRV